MDTAIYISQHTELLAHTLKSLNECIVIADSSDIIRYVNPAFVETYGYSEAEIIGKPSSIMWSAKNKSEVTQKILEETKLFGSFRGELFNRRKDGSDFPILLVTSIVRDDDKNPIAFVGISKDITDIKQYELELQTRAKTIEEQNRAISIRNAQFEIGIEYAKSLQVSLLTQRETIERFLFNPVFFHHPKEKVFGDFFWADQKFDRLLLASVEGGASGIAGAMLSMLINNYLNQIVSDEHLNQPNVILEKLHEKLSIHFNKEEPLNLEKGIHIGLITIPKNLRSFKYSGADTDLMLLRDGRWIKLSGDKADLGFLVQRTHGNYRPCSFITHNQSLRPGDYMFMFTGGIVRQINPSGESLGVERLLDFLQTKEHSPAQQVEKSLEAFIQKWKGSADQTEDWMLLGYRF